MVCARFGSLEEAVLAGAAATAAGAVVALLAEAESTRRHRQEELSASAQLRTGQQERDAAVYEERVLAAALEGIAEGVWITDASGAVIRHEREL